jgi:hypothetical protein
LFSRFESGDNHWNRRLAKNISPFSSQKLISFHCFDLPRSSSGNHEYKKRNEDKVEQKKKNQRKSSNGEKANSMLITRKSKIKTNLEVEPWK